MFNRPGGISVFPFEVVIAIQNKHEAEAPGYGKYMRVSVALSVTDAYSTPPLVTEHAEKLNFGMRPLPSSFYVCVGFGDRVG